MNKNWNDRADRDLFFTILSVKAIGIISGAEWTTIGNHMRSMGYGFTNEGCRQHFQGLRRTQHKTAASASVVPGGPRIMDPTMNPITRRPGPGRGRPRKNARKPGPVSAINEGQFPPPPDVQEKFLQQQAERQAEEMQHPSHVQQPPQVQLSPHVQQSPHVQLSPQVQHSPHIQQPHPSFAQEPFPPQEPAQQQTPQQPPVGQQQPQIPQPSLHVPVTEPSQQDASPAISPPTPAPASTPSAVPTSIPAPVSLPVEEQVGEPLDLQTASEEPEEHTAKRRRIEEEPTQESLDDEAVLALTGHENQPNAYPSPSGFEYGEA